MLTGNWDHTWTHLQSKFFFHKYHTHFFRIICPWTRETKMTRHVCDHFETFIIIRCMYEATVELWIHQHTHTHIFLVSLDFFLPHPRVFSVHPKPCLLFHSNVKPVSAADFITMLSIQIEFLYILLHPGIHTQTYKDTDSTKTLTKLRVPPPPQSDWQSADPILMLPLEMKGLILLNWGGWGGQKG